MLHFTDIISCCGRVRNPRRIIPICHRTGDIELQKQHETSDPTEKIKHTSEQCPVKFKNLEIKR